MTPGAVDIHFHGAFGIDLMKAHGAELDLLAEKLFAHGIAAFCPTTLSTTAPELAQTVSRLGPWIAKNRSKTPSLTKSAIPLGIHLEGPFINPKACGAHPPGAIRAMDFTELENLWSLSQGTLKIITLAPEQLTPSTLLRLVKWSKPKKIVLSMGHSHATTVQARAALQAGFTGVTHAWNAMRFHHREAGVMGAALGRKATYLEMIIDGEHVSHDVIRATRKLHQDHPICFVSDCAPAAQTDGRWVSFGPLQARFEKGAARLADGSLAGGGVLLTEAYRKWALREASETGHSLAQIIQSSLKNWSEDPLNALNLEPKTVKRLRTPCIQWILKSNKQLNAKYPT